MSGAPDWPTFEFTSWESFLTQASGLTASVPSDPPTYLFRGQPDASWGLTPSLLRDLPKGITPEEAIAIEARATVEFREHAPAVLSGGAFPRPQNGPQWWALMQHYGAPTRLLDWTASPYVAAYFACEQSPREPGAVFIAHPFTVSQQVKARYGGSEVPNRELGSANAPDLAFFLVPSPRPDRSVAQQGHFSLALNILADHSAIILRASTDPSSGTVNEGHVLKWIIPADLKLIFLRNLRVMNVAAHALFPGLDGLGRSVRDLIRTEPTQPGKYTAKAPA